MGLIKAAVGAVGSTLHDQWKEAIRCDDMPNDVLMVKKTTPNGVISNGSTVIVGPGQCAIIYDNGRIIDASAEEGVYTFDSSSTPSLFAGQFGGMFKEMWQRFTYNGATAKEQAVFFFNLKEIMDNKFGTPAPVPYKDWGHPIMNARTNSYIAMSVEIRCFGKYTFKIADPFTFMSQVAGTADIYRKNELVEQIRSEVIGTFSNVMNSLGSDKYKIEALELPNKTDEIKQIMDENVFDEPIRKRGISLVSFVVESVTLDDKSREKIDNYEVGGDAYQQQGVMTGAYANAIQSAASNANGAANGFMGLGMMNMTTGGVVGNINNAEPMKPQANLADKAKSPVQEEVKKEVTTEEKEAVTSWKCPKCSSENAGKFCTECGTKKQEEKFCAECGNKLDENAKFCPECGTPVK